DYVAIPFARDGEDDVGRLSLADVDIPGDIADICELAIEMAGRAPPGRGEDGGGCAGHADDVERMHDRQLRLPCPRKVERTVLRPVAACAEVYCQEKVTRGF